MQITRTNKQFAKVAALMAITDTYQVDKLSQVMKQAEASICKTPAVVTTVATQLVSK